MHDIDRVRLETHAESEMFASGPLEAEYFELGEAEAPWPGQSGEVFSETEEMELASEMLGITSEAEFDRFLGYPNGRTANVTLADRGWAYLLTGERELGLADLNASIIANPDQSIWRRPVRG